MPTLGDQELSTRAAEVLAGGGEMGALMRAFDWSTTPLGPVEGWPQALKTCVRLMLTSRQPMWLGWGDQLTFLYNDPYRAIVGGKHPQALGLPTAVVWREIWADIGPRIHSALGGGAGTYDEALLLIMERHGYPEETYYTFSYSPIPDDDGRVVGIFCANTDDTRRVIAERQLTLLRELAAELTGARTVQDACTLSMRGLETNRHDIPFAVLYLLDPDQRHAVLAGTANVAPGHPTAPATIAVDDQPSWPLSEVIGTAAPCLISDLGASFGTLPMGAWERPPDQAAALPIALAGQTSLTGVLIVGLNPYRLFDDDYQRFLGLVAGQITASIANARAYEEEWKRAEALAELDRAKTAFFSNVSHEFRTPLALALGPIADLLAGVGDLLSASDRASLEAVHRNHLRLLKLVNTLLDFTRIEAGRADAAYEPTDLAALTADLASVFRSAVERANLRLIVDCPPLPEPVYVDRDMWEKIVLNLLSNALKFTFEGTISVALRHRGDQVELIVGDTGTGIPAAELPHLFERFHRVYGARARTHEGTGIGLALVQELARLHGGAVRAESAVDVGTTFTVTLPTGVAHLPAERVRAARASTSTNERAAPYVEEALRWLPGTETEEGQIGAEGDAIPARGLNVAGDCDPGPARILIADDNADMREYLCRLLGGLHEIRAVADGRAALAAARDWVPDLILSDVMMPELDGIGLVQALRADPRTRAVPVVLLSARAGQEAAVEGIDAGADDYLVKPFSAPELLARVRSHVELARLRRRYLAQEQAAREEAEAARQRAEELAAQLRAERDRLRQVVDLLPAAVVVTDAALKIQVSNHAVRVLLGADGANPALPVEEGEAVPTDDAASFAAYGARHPDGTPYKATEIPLARAALRGEEVWGEQMLLRNAATGRDVPILVNASPLRDEDGTITGGVVVFQDITAIRDLERTREEFLSAAAHDLKTPLTSIRGHAELAQRRLARLDNISDAAAAPVLGQMARILDSTNAMLGLINELLDITRLETGGRLDLLRRPVDLVALVRDQIAEQQGATVSLIELEARAPDLVANVDAARIQRAVGNLLSNAIKYSPSGLPITVSVGRDDGAAEPTALITVADQGLGIPAADLPHIFDRFARAGNVVGHIQGTGIGLASVRGIVEQHGGTVSGESQEGQGSTFTIRLPLAT